MAQAIIIMPEVSGTFRDGPFAAKDGVPDQTYNVTTSIFNTPVDEYRAVIEFDLLNVSENVLEGYIQLNRDATSGPYPFQIDVFTYVGDGFLSNDDFSAGDKYTTFTYAGFDSSVVDVTSAINAALDDNYKYLGFNFRYVGQSDISVEGPFISYRDNLLFINERPPEPISYPIPEPASLILFGSGMAGAFLRRRKSSH